MVVVVAAVVVVVVAVGLVVPAGRREFPMTDAHSHLNGDDNYGGQPIDHRESD